MARLGIGFPAALLLCGLGSASFAQDSPAPAGADPFAAGAPKAHVKKDASKKGGGALSTAQPSSQEAEKAARLAEGRKKFFEQSTGFDNGGSDAPVTLGGGNGLSPTAGFKF